MKCHKVIAPESESDIYKENYPYLVKTYINPLKKHIAYF